MLIHMNRAPDPPMTPKSSAAIEAESARVAIATEDEVLQSPNTQPSQPTSRKRLAIAVPDLWEIPRIREGANKGAVSSSFSRNF